MNRFLKVLGSIALVVILCWVGLAVLQAGFDVTGDLFYWFRRKFLPGLLWAVVIGGIIWGAWILLFGPDD